MQHPGPADDPAAAPSWQNLFLEPAFAPGTAEYDGGAHTDPVDPPATAEPA